MAEFASRFTTLPGSGLQEMAILAREVPGAIALGVGDPNFTTPSHIIDSAARAARAGYTHYAPAAGLPDLRRAIADKVSRYNKIQCSERSVCVTTGASGGIFTTLATLLDPGDEVLIPDPGWPTYSAMVHLLGGIAKTYPLPRVLGFTPDLDALAAAISPATKVLILSSPANPTGVVLGRESLERMLDLARRHDLWVVSDECYDEIIVRGAHVSAAAVEPSERVITVFTFSKTYAMTGWRVGYVVAASEVASQVAKAQRPVNSATSTVAQKAAQAALEGPQDAVTEMVTAYRERGDAAMRLLDAGEATYVVPQGAFYVMVDVGAEPSREFARRLLTDFSVGVAPGGAFGREAEGTVRVSLAVSRSDIDQGIPRLVEALRRTPAPALR